MSAIYSMVLKKFRLATHYSLWKYKSYGINQHAQLNPNCFCPLRLDLNKLKCRLLHILVCCRVFMNMETCSVKHGEPSQRMTSFT